MISIFVHRNGRCEEAHSIDRGWLNPASGAIVWVDIAAPSIPESLILSETFGFHPLAVESAMSALQFPKVEPFDGYLYIVLHGIDFQASKHRFGTHDVDFFLGRNYLVTVHDGTSRSIAAMRDHCPRNANITGEGPVALFHRIIDAMVDNYRPEVEKLEDAIEKLEDSAFGHPPPNYVRKILEQKRNVSSLRRVTTPQRDVIGRLARREFVDIGTEMAFRFRDVYDHVVRVNEEAILFQDRLGGILDAHLSSVSNRLNQVMKVLTVLTTIFMPLTVITGLYGMNVRLPEMPGGEAAQFWWLVGFMLVLVAGMLALFRRFHWL